MPPVVAAIAALAGAIAKAITVAGIVKAIVGSTLSIGLSMGAAALSKKNAAKTGLKDAGSRINISQSSVDTHKIIYGRVRVSGTLVVSHSEDAAGRANNLLHFYIALAAHEVDGFEESWINEKKATIDAEGRVTNLYLTVERKYRVVIRHFSGRDNQRVDILSPLMTSDHRMRGIALSKIILIWDRTAFPNGVPQFSEVVRGRKLYDPRATQITVTQDVSGLITTASAHGLNVDDSVWVVSPNDNKAREMRVNKIPGPNQLTLRDPYSGSELDAALGLTAADRLSKMAWSNNWALVVRDYLANPQWGLGARQSEIDDATIIAAANLSDEIVTLKDGTTEKRYTANGVIDTADGPFDVIEALRTAGGPGIITFAQGRWKVLAAAYNSPVATITADWLAGDIQVQARLPRKDLFNAVKGVYIAPDKQWQPTDFPPVTNAFYEGQDNRERIYKDIQFPFTTSVSTAQRLAKILLERGRQQIVATLPCNLRALQLGIGDTVYLDLPDLGWTNKVFRVERWEMDQEDGVLVTVKEEAAAAYAWNNGEETTFDLAPDTNLPDPNFVLPPGNPIVTEVLYSTTEGAGFKSKATLSWAESQTFNIDRYVIQYRSVGDTGMTPAGETITTRLDILDLAPGVYEFFVHAITLMGAESLPSSTIREIAGISTPPEDLANFSMSAVNNQAHLSWGQSPDLDVRIGGYIRLRWANDPDGTWAEGIDFGDALPGIATSAVVPLLNGAYLIKAVDASGNESVNAARIETNMVNVLNLNTLATIDENPGFTGSKTNMVVVSGTLQLDGPAGASEMDGEYVFGSPLDLGAIYTARTFIGLSSQVFDTVNTFDETDGLFDGREGLFDGADLAGVRLEFFIKTTNADPTGSTPDNPMWTPWRKFVVGDFTCRAFWVKTVVTNTKASYNVAIDALSLNVDVPDRIERVEDLAVATGGTSITYTKPFFAKPTVGSTIQAASGGDTLTLTHITSGGKWTGLTVQVLAGSGGVARTVDLVVQGY